MQEKFDYFSVNKRILMVMREKGLNKNSLSKLIGLSQPALKKIESNENLPSFKLLFEILNVFPDISPEWLLTGKGEKLKDTDAQAGKEVDEATMMKSLIESNTSLAKSVEVIAESNRDLAKSNAILVAQIAKSLKGAVSTDAEVADAG